MFSQAISHQSWCYTGCEESPSLWHSLSNSHCGGVRQSPINIDTTQLNFDPNLDRLTFSNISHPYSITNLVNNGHTVNCMLTKDVVKVMGGGLSQTYTAVQIHFHWGRDYLWHPGSEHTVNSVRYPMEMHLVTLKKGLTFLQAKIDPTGIAVFGFFIAVTENPRHDDAWKTLTSHLVNITEIGSTVNIRQALPLKSLLGSVDLTRFYRYQGSLTTPGCEEAVVWTIFKEPIKIGSKLMVLFPKNLKYVDIYRPLQNQNNRTVYTSPKSDSSSSSQRDPFLCHLAVFQLLLWLVV